MASLSSIRSGIATNLGNISTLTVFGFVPDSIEPPTAVVGVVDNIGGGYAICVNQDCDVANDQIEPILKSEFTKEVA